MQSSETRKKPHSEGTNRTATPNLPSVHSGLPIHFFFLLFSPPPSGTAYRRWKSLLLEVLFFTMISMRALVAPSRQCLRGARLAPRYASPFSQVRLS